MSSLLPLKSSTEELADRDLDPLLVGFDEAAADDVLAVVTSTTARRILATLYDDPKAPSEIADAVGTSLQNVGYHLSRLEEAGLVEVADTWYSEKGREMNVYAPAHGPLVLFAGAERARPSLSTALSRLFGAVGVVALASVLVHAASRTRPPTVVDRVQSGPTPDLVTQIRVLLGQFLAGPGALTLAVGVGLVVGLFVLWYFQLYRPTRSHPRRS